MQKAVSQVFVARSGVESPVVQSAATPEAIGSSSGPISAETKASTEDSHEAGDRAYRRMLQSTALIGMSSIANVTVGMVRTKMMAMLLDPAGFGVMGLYNSIADLAVSIAGMGVNNSGVRQIAEAESSGDSARLARTITVLRRVSAILGLVGAGALALFSARISVVTFGDDSKATAIAILALAVFLRLISAGQGALLQGMRRIADIAKVTVGSSVFATVVSIPIIYFLREDGIALSIAAVAAMSTATYWWYNRQIILEKPSLSLSDVAADAADLLKLGLAFMLSGLLMVGSAYAVRLIIARDISLEAAGLYSSAWTLSGLYVGYVLQAMSTDFYPRLVSVVNDRDRCNRLVNEQTLISVLLAGPGILATITFAPVIVSLFYSFKFNGAVEVLRWTCAGMAMRVITWPMGYIIVAKNRQLLFLAVDLGWTVANIALTWTLLNQLGLTGAGVAFLISYLLHALCVYPIARTLTGFEWSEASKRASCLYISSITLTLIGLIVLSPSWSLGVGSLLTAINTYFSLRMLMQLFHIEQIPRPFARILSRLPFINMRRVSLGETTQRHAASRSEQQSQDNSE